MKARASRVLVGMVAATVLLWGCAPQPGTSPTPTSGGPRETLSIFLHTGNPDDCAEVVAVERTVDADTLSAAMEALLAGPTEEERSQGLGGWFSEETKDLMNSAVIEEDVAKVDFQDLRPVIPNASTSCGSAMLLAQLDSTARQFPQVESTLYSINGSPEDFYEWLQMGVPT